MAALWDLACASCNTVERNVPCSIFAVPPCPRCGGERGLTDVAEYHPFIPYFDIALGRQVDSLADRWNGMKRHEDANGEVDSFRLEYKDKVPKGELSARRDRIEQQKRERGRR